MAVAVAVAGVGANTVVPPPSGPYSVITEVYDLTDESRWDPFASANATHKRRILASTFLPAVSCHEEVITPFLPPVTEAVYLQVVASFGLPPELLTGFEVGYCAGGTYPEQEQGFPLIVLSPGSTTTRLFHTVLARDLASVGYAVVTIDHPYDSLVVEFPDGSVTTGPLVSEEPADLLQAVDVRSQDISFLLDQLADLELPIDMSKIVAVGHSMGGWASAVVSMTDDRVLGGMNFDGMVVGPVVEAGLSKPFVLIGSAGRAESGYPDGWRDFYDNSLGTKMIAVVNETVHNSFFDLPYLLTLKEVPVEILPPLYAALGSIDGEVLLNIERELVDGLAKLIFEGDASSLKAISEEFEQVMVLEEHIPGSCR